MEGAWIIWVERKVFNWFLMVTMESDRSSGNLLSGDGRS